jgi:hypothetical protein
MGKPEYRIQESEVRQGGKESGVAGVQEKECSIQESEYGIQKFREADCPY